jgi:23S rRNA pseudouridine2605 synthase
MRLAKYLAHAGVASRRASETIIAAGRVTVDGAVVTDPARDVDDSHTVKVDGKRVRTAGRVVYLVNKPPGVVSTANDPQGRATVVSLVPSRERLYPVGRLDYETTGLILLTNDGDLAHRLTHPSFEVPRTYRARIANAPINEPALRALREGVELEDGLTAPAKVRRVSSSELELTIHEGRKRQVRRMLEAVGHPVRTLERVAFGPLRLGALDQGEHRALSPAEIERLRSLGQSRAVRGGGSPPG